jgi:D-alanine-D-alanine ligase
MKKNIALMAGGDSGEYEISILSAKNVQADLDNSLYNVYFITTNRGKWIYKSNDTEYEINKTDFSLLLGNEKVNFDAVFIMIHGTPGENGLLQGYFDMLEIKYTGCSAFVSAVTFDKAVCNEVVRNSQMVSVAKNIAVFKQNKFVCKDIIAKVAFPAFVKPSQGGSSLTTFKVNNEKELEYAINKAFEVDSKVMIEQFIKGRELTCGVFDNETFPITEILTEREFFDYEAKYNGLSREITPANITHQLQKRLQATASNIYNYLGCKGVCRVDFIYDESNDEIYFLEINTIPGQSSQSIVPQQVRAAGKSTVWLYNSILEQCF